MTYRIASDLDEVIRTRAVTLFGPWPDGMTMFVYPEGDFWNISLSAATNAEQDRYIAGVRAVFKEIRIDAEIHALRAKKRRGPGSEQEN